MWFVATAMWMTIMAVGRRKARFAIKNEIAALGVAPAPCSARRHKAPGGLVWRALKRH